MESHHVNASKDRRARLIASVASAIVSRTAGLLVQVIALPIVLAVLGTSHYAAYIQLQASFGWFGLLGLGIAIALPRFLSAAAIHDDRHEERQLVLTTTVLVVLVGALAAGATFAIGMLIGPQRLLHLPGGLRAGEVANGFAAIAFFIGLRFMVSIVTAVRSGYQELSRVYVMTTLANLLVIGLVVFALPPGSPLWLVFCYSYAPIVTLLALDYVLLLVRRPYLVRGDWHPVQTMRRLLPVSLNAVLKQVSFFLMSSGAVLVLGHMQSAQNIAAFGTVITLMMLAASGFAAIYQPLLAAMANAHSHGDKRWFRKAYFGGLGLTVAVTGLVAIVCGLAGPWLALHWMRADLGITRFFISAMALYFMVWMLSDYHFNVLAAMAKLGGLGKIYVLEGIAALLCGSLLAPRFGIEGMAVGLAVGTAAFSLFYLPLRAWAIIQHDGWVWHAEVEAVPPTAPAGAGLEN
ncbi:MAG: hypothetical protein WDM91_14180 [Rhizomicrobium sp.]